MKHRFRLASLAVVAVLTGLAAADVQNVRAATLSVPSQYSTLEAALQTASSGDVIELSPGYYPENNLVVAGGVTITGLGTKPQDVLIDGGGENRILLIESAADTVTIRNITFMSGHAQGPSGYDRSGGALLISNSNARIENCVFSANSADGHGGAIRVLNSSPVIESCSFYANTAPLGGGGALDLSYGSSPLVRDCEFLANRADWGGAISCRGGSSPRVESSDLFNNEAGGVRGFGGGVFADTESFPDLLGATIAENSAPFGGGLASWRDGAINLDYSTVVYNKSGILEGGMLVVDSSPLVTGSIVAFNEGRGIVLSGDSQLQVTCTDLYGNTSGDWVLQLAGMETADGNLAVDPQFCSIQPGNEHRFHLGSSSPVAGSAKACGVLGAKPVSCSGSGEKSLSEVPVVSAAIGKVQASPNPFNPRTQVSFELALAQDVKVSVYGLDGRLVHELANGRLDAGAHQMVWEGRDRSGRQVGSGVYFVLVQGREDTQRLKVTLLK